jgi:hypothetical protein
MAPSGAASTAAGVTATSKLPGGVVEHRGPAARRGGDEIARGEVRGVSREGCVPNGSRIAAVLRTRVRARR